MGLQGRLFRKEGQQLFGRHADGLPKAAARKIRKQRDSGPCLLPVEFRQAD